VADNDRRFKARRPRTAFWFLHGGYAPAHVLEFLDVPQASAAVSFTAVETVMEEITRLGRDSGAARQLVVSTQGPPLS